MATVRVRVDAAAARGDANRMAAPTVRSVTRRVLNRSAVLCPVDTGRLRASGRMSIGSSRKGTRGRVDYPTRYATMVHDGTAPHAITARRGRVLRYAGRGGVVYARSVRHPGTRARPYLTTAAREVAAQGGYRYTR